MTTKQPKKRLQLELSEMAAEVARRVLPLIGPDNETPNVGSETPAVEKQSSTLH
jgi:hypothetical protein